MAKSLQDAALNCAQLAGAEYADIRILDMLRESIVVKNGRVESAYRENSAGFGVRVLLGGAWGFSSSRLLSSSEVERVAGEAIEIARATQIVQRKTVELAPAPVVQDAWATPVTKDPFVVPLEDKLSLLKKAVSSIQAAGVSIAEGSMNFWKCNQAFASTEGSRIEQTIVHSGGGISATSVKDGEIQVRSYPNSFRGQYQSGGYEMIEAMNLVDNAERVASEAVALHAARQCPSGTMTVILDGSQLGLQIHESCGHPAELDRALGSEINFAGTSFLTPDKLGGFRYGADIVNIVADATQQTSPGGLGTFAYDDEGVPAQRIHIVRDGIFTGYLSSRETAREIGSQSTGAMRASGWNRIPLVRMTNVSLLPGDSSLGEMIATTKNGIFLCTNRSWSIDDKRLHFQFGTEVGWLVKNGRLAEMVKNPTYSGVTPRFWSSCDAIAGPKEWVIWGTPNCGKGQPEQVMHTGHGASPARFQNVSVGVGYGN
ncbi:MAG: TldD/PmbA family protein [Candidatus Abyssobacteria bacterium SURF_17]|jgi:TldD protein|uniref:TldD/PmbA family protein n=1 Tax=Candidatus Abyssobacteria bacterium SURF_17 TaxID=2093361 RepID=A0A419F2Q2_9BACT|nr:MAG: TldD/PmbA family protein [Candidatus Abyssubacteria bacterium SURF_17]